MAIAVKRKAIKFCPDPKRVIARFYMPGDEKRGHFTIEKILTLNDETVHSILTRVLGDFAQRHRNITKVFENSFSNIKRILRKMDIDPDSLSLERKLLIGSYFTHEYAIEPAAFFNPSVVADPNQSDLEEGQKRIIVSFRATGEGHISSVVFRSGIVDKNNELIFKPVNQLVEGPETIERHVYKKRQFHKKLDEMNVRKKIVGMIMDSLSDNFTYAELQSSIHDCIQNIKLTYTKKKVIQAIVWVARAHYDLSFSLDTAISERVIFPSAECECNGIEDSRFVRFTDDEVTYYATYTAYNGFTILPRLMETKDFYHFTVKPLLGECVQNKGMAIFPRKIDGRYATISRLDGFRNYLMYSDNIQLWEHAERIQEPTHPWEFVQIGNCGSPLETKEGWLLITHGVGPMRRYCLGAMLLDLKDPARIIGQLTEPLLIPNDEEREGYVPNVVYSCGSIIHNNELIIPYGVSDTASTFATVALDELFSKMN